MPDIVDTVFMSFFDRWAIRNKGVVAIYEPKWTSLDLHFRAVCVTVGNAPHFMEVKFFGSTVMLGAAYPQLITNAVNERWGYTKPPAFSKNDKARRKQIENRSKSSEYSADVKEFIEFDLFLSDSLDKLDFYFNVIITKVKNLFTVRDGLICIKDRVDATSLPPLVQFATREYVEKIVNPSLKRKKKREQDKIQSVRH